MTNRPVITTILAISILFLTGCFTGVESTPKISSRDLRREQIAQTSEMQLAARLNPQPPAQWQPGRQFIVTDSRLSRLLNMETPVTHGDTITYTGQTVTRQITGDTIAVLQFLTHDNRPLSYPTGIHPRRILADTTLTLPFLIDLNLVALADSLLTGNQYYILTNLRVDTLSQPIANSRRYITVRITGVHPGNTIYPLRIQFIDDNDTPGSVVMTVGDERSATRNFNRIFSFANPRNLHPQITDDIWQTIIAGQLRPGMTLEECRLSIGTPADIRRGHNGTSYFEQWTFDNGAYLIFEDGLLKTYRL